MAIAEVVGVLDVVRVGSLVLTQIRSCGDEDNSGLFSFAGSATPLATGSSVPCPGAITSSRSSGPLERFAAGGGSGRLTLTRARIAVAPEVDATSLAVAAIATLAVLARGAMPPAALASATL